MNGLSNADAAHTTQVNEAGNAYTCLKQNDVNLQDASRCPRPARTRRRERRAARSRATSRTRRSRSTTTSRRRTRRARRTRSSPSTRPNGWLNPAPGSPGRLHPRHRPPLLPRAVPARRRQAGPLRHGQRRDGPDAWASTTRRPCRSTSTCTRKDHPELRDRGQLLPGGVRRVVPQPPVADRSGLAGRSDAAHRAAPTQRRHPVLDANGMPSNEPLYTSTITPPIPPDRELTATCAQVATLPAPINQLACGNYGVNTMQPAFYPSGHVRRAAARRRPRRRSATG